MKTTILNFFKKFFRVFIHKHSVQSSPKVYLFIFFLFYFMLSQGSLIYSNCEFNINNINKDYISLNGNWNFFKGGGSIGANPDLDISEWKFIKVPFVWNAVKELKNYKGELWIRCNVIFTKIPEELIIDLGFIKEIDEVYWNGSLIGSTGNFNSKIPDFSERRIYVVPPSLIQEKNVIAIHLFGSFWFAGIPDPPKLYFKPQLIHQKFKFEMLALSFSLTYIFSSVFFIIYGFYTQEKKANLFFALFTIFLAMYHMILWGQRYNFFSNYIVSYIVELLLLIPLPFLFLSFLKEWLQIDELKFYKGIFYYTIFAMILTIIGYFIPYIYRTIYLHIVTYLNLINIVFSTFLTIKILFKHKKVGGNQIKYLTYGLLLLVPFLLNDVLVATNLIHTPRLFVFSYPIFLIAVALALSEKALSLKFKSLVQVDEIRKLEKQKLNVIYNISNQFHSIFDEIKQSIIQKKDHESALIQMNYLLESGEILNLLEKHQYTLQPVKINLNDETKKIIDDVLSSTKQKKNRLSLNLPQKDTSFWMDSTLYKMILYQILKNALLYSLEKVELTISVDDNLLKIRVYDQGSGIPEEIQNKIFNKYIRGNTKIPGSGIGLALVYESIKLLDGQIHYESKQDFYTMFEVFIPELKELS